MGIKRENGAREATNGCVFDYLVNDSLMTEVQSIKHAKSRNRVSIKYGRIFQIVVYLQTSIPRASDRTCQSHTRKSGFHEERFRAAGVATKGRF